MRTLLKKYWPLVLTLSLSCFAFLVCSIIYFSETSFNQKKEAKKLEDKFHLVEINLDVHLDSLVNFIDANNFVEVKEFNKRINQNTTNFVHLHVFKSDSLLYWNSNLMPISRFVDVHFPSNGLLKLQNGWYFSKAEKVNDYIVSVSFLIKNEFQFENEFLNNNFSSYFNLPTNTSLVLEKESGLPIFTKSSNYLFSIIFPSEKKLSDNQSFLLVGFLLLGIILLLYFIYQLVVTLNFIKGLIVLVLFSLLFSLIFVSNFFSFLNNTVFFDPTLFANSYLFPNLFYLLTNSIYFLFLVITIFYIVIRDFKKNATILYFLHLLNYLFFFVVLKLINLAVKDSSIPIEIGKLFKLNAYSFLLFCLFGFLLFTYLKFNFKIITAYLERQSFSKSVLLLLSSILFVLFCYFSSEKIVFFVSFVPFFLVLLHLFFGKLYKLNFKHNFIFIFLASIIVSFVVQFVLLEKQFYEREVYANQFASDQDISTEIEFRKVKNELKKVDFLKKIATNPKFQRQTELKNYLEKNIFVGFWERYEMDCFLYKSDRTKLENSPSNLEDIISKHSRPSQLDKDFYYIKDFANQLSYVAKITLFDSLNFEKLSTKKHTLYILLKSKRIPEKIGFPRLLVSDNSNVLQILEDYSIAKYFNKKLISQYGSFSYPSSYKKLAVNKNNTSGFYNFDAYDHYIYRKNDNDVIVLSKKETTIFQLITSFSYLFCFYCLIFFVYLLIYNAFNVNKIKLTFALKIQFALLSLVVISITFFGLSSGFFIKEQYNEYAHKLLKEKIKSVEESLNYENSNQKRLTIESDGEILNSKLTKFASIFHTDINMYDLNGYLLASSRQKLFNLGLQSEQINPEAFEELKNYSKSDFILNENIGNLNYLSVYYPIINANGKMLAFVNLQHFGQQKEFENQIEQFLLSIINIFIFLFVLSVVIAFLVSNWLTIPLKALQLSLNQVQMGKYNKPILYNTQDEIGQLVKNYNQKLTELAFTANQLAQSEREMAWREMAKQVAHEIKNPLTPMKLSLQHLKRIYDPQNPISNEKLSQVIESLIEQIDTLTKIANEFSSFAKMPKESLDKMDLIPIINNILLVFNQDNEYLLEFSTNQKSAFINGDKNLMLQVFNNVVTNAIQAIANVDYGRVTIDLDANELNYIIEIKDNGKGIPEEIQNRIFEPNFTTKSSGSGLGLALCKQIILAHHGQISFETKNNEFTKFTIILPKFTVNG